MDKLGFVILTNLEPAYGGIFNFSVQSSLLSRLFGLNRTLPTLLAGAVPVFDGRMAALAAPTRPVDPAVVAPYLGLYRDGFRLRLDDAGVLRLDHDIRSLPLLALPDGSYVVVDGPAVVSGKKVTFAAGAEGRPRLTIEGFEPVAWLSGG